MFKLWVKCERCKEETVTEGRAQVIFEVKRLESSVGKVLCKACLSAYARHMSDLERAVIDYRKSRMDSFWGGK